VIAKRDRCVAGHGAPPDGRIYQGLVSGKRAAKKEANVTLAEGNMIEVSTGL
jgi:hypothetical protein